MLFPETTQGFNRDTYVNNNPLSYTDPSGHEAISLTVAAIIAGSTAVAAGEIFDEPVLTQVGFAILGSATGTWWQAAGVGFGAGFTASGGNLKAGLYSAATAATFFEVGSAVGQAPGGEAAFGAKANYYVRKAVVHGIVGGASSDLQGGSFSDGFVGAAAAQAAAPGLNSGFGNRIGVAGRVAFAATIGGTASELSGGKFAKGQ